MGLQSFKELHVWKRSIELVKEVYLVTNQMPKTEQFGLMSQMRRSAVSIPSNIAEGSKRKTQKDYLQFLHIADGSCSELETQIIILKELYSDLVVERVTLLLQEVQRMLGSLMKAINKSF